jgi:hypothetical protein
LPRYFFHVFQNGRKVPDREGTVCDDLTSAKLEAVGSAKELARQAIDSDVPPSTVCLEIVDEEDRVLAALTVGELLDNPTHPKFHDTCEPGTGEV